MKLLVGLGNPWEKYKLNRHNVWFIVLEKFCQKNLSEQFSYNNNFFWQLAEINFDWDKIIALKPMTFMNLSGKAIAAVANFYKIKNEDIALIYDDIDLPTGKIRLRFGWSAGGHKWVKSTIQSLGTDEFYRIRIWVDRPPDRSMVTKHVLSNFPEDELKTILDKINEVEDIIKNNFLKKDF